MVVSLIIAGFFALIAGAATWAVVRLQRIEIVESKKEFEQYKLEAGERIETAKADAAEATRSAEGEKLARLKLEEKLAPRRLKERQQQIIGRVLVAFAGKTVRLESYGLDAESAIVGLQIKSALALANINVDDSGLMTRQSGGSIALAVHVTGRDNSLVGALIAAISGEGIQCTPEEAFPTGGVSFGGRPPSTPPDATVFVGIKPIAE